MNLYQLLLILACLFPQWMMVNALYSPGNNDYDFSYDADIDDNARTYDAFSIGAIPRNSDLGRRLYNLEATNFFANGLNKFLAELDAERNQNEMQAQQSSETTTATTTTTKIAETTILETTTPEIMETTTNCIAASPTTEKAGIWYNMKSLITKVDKDYNPIEPISKAIDDVKESDTWKKINEFSTKSAGVIKENFQELEHDVKDSWRSIKDMMHF